ncbi:hypothetical protein [Streptomyces sp. G1]|uniref:hypothetical protein n=1 Tax=Streptomyces sp. G1 TaxID=361572 RepID=UPI00202E9328|nr:hypothetical protein [Streptomyces sp. G1]MCM1974537.1 hypothetical protein [Streptomyces sp. G1]
MLTAAALIEPYVDDSVDIASRIGSIAFHRGVRGESWEAPVGLPASLAWGLWAARVNVLALTRGRTQSLYVLPTLDGRTLIAALAIGGAVRIWDSETGRLAAKLGGHPGLLQGMCPIHATGGRTFLVTWHGEGVTIQDPGSGQVLTAMSARAIRTVHVLEDGADRWTLFVITAFGASVWWPNPLGTGPGTIVEAVGFPETAYPEAGAAPTVVVRRAGGQALVALSTSEGIRLWDPSSGLTPHPPFANSPARSVLAVSRPGEDDLLLVVGG